MVAAGRVRSQRPAGTIRRNSDMTQYFGAGSYVLIEAPDGQVVEGKLAHKVEVDTVGDVPFRVICDDTGETIRINAPWDCDIQIEGDDQ